MDVLIDKGIPLLLMGLVFLCDFALGSPPASAVRGGPRAVIGRGLLCALLAGAGTGFLNYEAWDILSLGDIVGLSDPTTVFTVTGILGAVCALVPPVLQLITGHKEADALRETAPRVKSFGTSRFGEIDRDGDGTISDQDMAQAQDVLSLTADERVLLGHMRSEQSEVGHVVSSYTTTTTVLIPMSNGTLLPQVQTSTDYVYGISRDDLDTYPARINEKYKRW